MIYLDTSAFLKLYIREGGSEQVHSIVVAQRQPLPVVDFLHAEFLNALRLKVFWGELDSATAEHLIALFDDRVYRGQYVHVPTDRVRLLKDFRSLSVHTQSLGCRSLDILHVASALQLEARTFVTFDERQRELAFRAGLTMA